MNKIIYVDVDGTLCTIVEKKEGQDAPDYIKAQPLQKNIDLINRLFDEGNIIVIWTARGCTTGIDWWAVTECQLSAWGVRYTRIDNRFKPNWDLYIGDKCMNVEDWK